MNRVFANNGDDSIMQVAIDVYTKCAATNLDQWAIVDWNGSLDSAAHWPSQAPICNAASRQGTLFLSLNAIYVSINASTELSSCQALVHELNVSMRKAKLCG
jgi:hypothetical protein